MITLVLEEQINVSVIKIFVPGLYSGNFELSFKRILLLITDLKNLEHFLKLYLNG